jgi:CheY-like chemotaxis protein
VPRRKKILLVDDSATILLLEQRILGPFYDVITAKDGSSAVVKALAEQPDLIVLDMIMPGMDGLSACQALRAEQATRQTPIVMMTSQKEESHVKAGYRSGCSAYLTKPIDGPALLATVRGYLSE